MSKLILEFDALQARVTALERENAAAYREALSLATILRSKHYPEVPQWRPLGDLVGLLTQIDNMTSGLERVAQKDAQP